MTGVDAVARELRTGGGDVGVGGREPLVLAVPARLEQAVLLQLARQLGRYPGPLAERRERQLLLVAREPRGTAAPAGLRGGRRRELLADHAQRQGLVALQAQDRLEPLDVLLVEQAVPALGAPRREQALVLEIADLRDRDVGELLAQAAADRADGQALLAGERFGRRAHESSGSGIHAGPS